LVDDSLASVARSPMPAMPDNQTRLNIDGDPSDWSLRPSVVTDPPDDIVGPGFDFRSITAFVNDDALYVLAEGRGSLNAGSIEMDLTVDGREIRLGWGLNREYPDPWIGEPLPDEWRDLGNGALSTFAFGDAFEARIALSDIFFASSIELTQLQIYEGECCDAEYEVADEWRGSFAPATVNQYDPEWRMGLPGSAQRLITTLSAPDTRAIDVLFEVSTGVAQITGHAGAVPPLTNLLVGNLERNDFIRTTADITGGFSASLASAPGSHILIKHDTTGMIIRQNEEQLGDENMIAPGVLIDIPGLDTGEGVSFAAGARLCCNNENTGSWGADGSLSIDREGQLRARGRLIVYAGPGTQPVRENVSFYAELVVDESGRQIGRSGKFVTPFLTATGLPIEATLGGEAGGVINIGNTEADFDWDGAKWVGDFDVQLELREGMREGIWAVHVDNLWRQGNLNLQPDGTRPFTVVIRDHQFLQAFIGTIDVGSIHTPRLATLLLADEASEGSRGGYVAREDEGTFDIAIRASTRHAPVLPRVDTYGDAWMYQLEPFAPMLDVVDRALPNPPIIDLDLTRSQLTVTVRRPDGRTDTLGPASMTRYAVKSPRTPQNQSLGGGGGELREIPQLLGDPGVFAYEFPTDGDYVVSLSGQVADLSGRPYAICGTYDVRIGNVLDIEMGFLPTTPFEVGDTITPVLTTFPGVPVEVTTTVLHVASDGTETIVSFSGKAGPNGYWDGGGQSLTFQVPGEYRVDVDARYEDEAGNVWSGRLRSGSVITTPNTPLIVHGRRGPDNQEEIAPPWAFETAFTMESSDHMQFPYFNGDVLWGIEDTDAGDAVVSHVSVQLRDSTDPLLNRAVEITENARFTVPPLPELIRAGQIPLTLAAEDVRNELVGSHPDDIGLWTYMYSSAERPGVRVRETVQGDDVSGAYWRFGDPYLGQSGNGPDGDKPDDFKFLYAAAVVRDEVTGEGHYAAYGSAWVFARDDDPLGSRFFPPFQGAAGGPDGGPLFTVHDREVDIFFLPQAVRPGAILERGDTFSMSGAVMPTLPSLIEYTVIAPNGARRSLGGRANAVGYFYDPSDDFVLDQAGEWKVDLTVTHDGQTSAGQVMEPFPTGGVLSPDGHTYTFVVRDTAALELNISTTLSERDYQHRNETLEEAWYSAPMPPGFTATEATVTVTMPGNVLIHEEATLNTGTVSWRMAPAELGRIADNFDHMCSIGDTVTVTFLVKGMRENSPATAVGTIVTHGGFVPVTPAHRGQFHA
jgi:hypothetical protein